MGKKLKLSPWHDGSVKPVHVGPYEGYDEYTDRNYFSWYDGKDFRGWWWNLERALINKDADKDVCITKWRGVLK